MISPHEMVILGEVGRWKVIWVADLYKVMGTWIFYTMFCKKIGILEKKGCLSGRYFRRLGKYVYLTEKGSALSSTGARPDEPAIDHDLICSEVILKLLKFDNFLSGSASDGPDSELDPDGVIQGVKNGSPYTLAIEVELSQKSEFRVEQKFADYTREDAHDFALYVTHKKSLFDNYRRTLSKMKPRIRQTIVLSLAEKLGAKQYDHHKAIYWLDGNEYSFDALFGEEDKHDE